MLGVFSLTSRFAPDAFAQIPLVTVGHTNDNPGLRAYALGVAVMSSYVYLANSMDSLRVYDVSDPTHSGNIGHGTAYGFQYARSVALGGNHAYVADGSLAIYDVSNPLT